MGVNRIIAVFVERSPRRDVSRREFIIRLVHVKASACANAVPVRIVLKVCLSAEEFPVTNWTGPTHSYGCVPEEYFQTNKCSIGGILMKIPRDGGGGVVHIWFYDLGLYHILKSKGISFI